MNKTIIITSGTSARAQSMARLYPEDQIIFADSMPVPKPFLSSGKFIQLPFITAPHFIHELLKACLNHSTDMLILLEEEETQLVLPQKTLFEEYNIEIVC